MRVRQVANASVGANTVLWNIDWQEGDVIVGCESFVFPCEAAISNQVSR